MMVDIETYDTEITAVILSIGAVTFCPRTNWFAEDATFYRTINRKQQLGRTTSEQTKEWWAMQDQEAQDAVFKGPHTHLVTALREFTEWINKMRPTCTRIWAKSPDFDCSILKHACDQENILWPFKFWETRCCRTIMELAYPEGDFPHVDVVGPKHDALVDAKRQALEVQHAYHVLNA